MTRKILNIDHSADARLPDIPDSYLDLGLKRLPFETKLSFEPLIRLIEEKNRGKGCTETLLAKELMERLQMVPEIRGPIEDTVLLQEHRELLDILIGMVLSPFTRETQLAKIAKPFDLDGFYYTPALLKMAEENEISYQVGEARNIIYIATVISACSLILNKFYGQNLTIDPPVSITVRNPENGLVRHFKTHIDIPFVDIKMLKPLLPITQTQINHLLSNIYDMDHWLKLIPPDHFAFHGFVIGTLVDITEEEAVSRLKFRLLSKDAIVDSANVLELQDLLRRYFRISELRLGISAIDYPPRPGTTKCYNIRFDFLSEKHKDLFGDHKNFSIYDKACRYKEVLLIEDLTAMEPKTPIEHDLIQEGIRSIIVAPLLNKWEEVIGILEIGSPEPFRLHSFIELKFKNIISMFTLAVERSRKEIDNQIEAVIREQFTAVHPIVEWRFMEAAHNLLKLRESNDPKAMIEPIVFNDVYALYGQTDIVSSSEKRNDAIKADLIENLNLVIRCFQQCLGVIDFPLLDQLYLKVTRMIGELERDYISSDETRVIELLHQQIHPLLDNLRESQADLTAIIIRYFSELDPDLGIVYKRRKAYEESVTMLTSDIAAYLDEQDKITQRSTPHYFEKYKTDGVEYDMYIGQSLMQHGTFCLTHFRNLRLWQLLHMVAITRKVEAMQSRLSVPLETAQLIFAYNAPLSIRFRMDEKHFDVDGAYNVRYQILKKRIDKATIEGTDQRLTLSGKIAVVFLHEKEREEYLDYFEYLRHEGLIQGEVEELLLSRMQGVQGLRALRVSVSPDKAPFDTEKMAEKAVSTLMPAERVNEN